MERGAKKQVSFEVSLPEQSSAGTKQLTRKKNGCKPRPRVPMKAHSQLKQELPQKRSSRRTSDATATRKSQRASKEQFYTFARHHSVMIRNPEDVFPEPSEDPDIDDSGHENTVESSFKFVKLDHDLTPVLADAVPPAVVVKMEPGTSTAPQQPSQPSQTSQPNNVKCDGSAARLQAPVPSTYHNTNTNVPPDGSEIKATNNSRLDHISKVLHDNVLCAELGALAVKRLREKYLELLLEE